MANEQYRASDFVRKMAEESRKRQEKYAADLDAKHKAKDAQGLLSQLDSGIKKQQNQVNTVKGRGAGLSATKPTKTETQLAEKYAEREKQRNDLLSVDVDKITDNKMRDQVLGAQLGVAKKQAQEVGYVNPRAKTSATKKEEQAVAQKQLATVNRDKVRSEKIVRYEDKTYDDTFSGQTGANYAVGRLTQDSSLAWSEYLDNPTEKNRKYAETLDATLAQFTRRNQHALDDKNVKMSWISKSLANYIPQFLDQTGAAIQGGIIGATAGAALGPVGWVNGAKAGVVAASGAYSYKTMRGAAFKALIESGVDEATAREAANDEAFVSALIEMADTGIDMVTFGGAKLLTVLGKSGWKGVGKLAAEWAGQDVMKRFAVVAGKYGLNVASEALEEASQEAVSIANQNRIAKGDTDSSLVWGAAKTFWGALTGKNKEAADQIWAAAEEGAKIAAMMGGADIVTTQTTTKVVSRVQAEMVGAGVRAAGEELNMLATAKTDYDTNTRTHKLAVSLESKMKAENRATLTDLEAGRLFEQMARDDAGAQLKAEKQTKKDTKAVKKETKPTKKAGAVEAKVETDAKIDAQTEADLVKLATSENQEQTEYANAQLSNPGATVVSPVARKLMAAGVKNDVAVEQAALLQKMSAGHKLTEAEIQKLQLSDPAVRAVIESETGVQVTGTSKSDKRKLTQSIIKSAAEVKAQEARTRQAVAEQQAGQVIVAQARAEAQAAADAVAPATEAVLGETVAAPAETPVLRDSGVNVSVPAGSIEYADGSVQTFEQFAKAYEKRHPNAKATTVVRKFHEYQLQNQMGQKVPGSAKKAAKTTIKPKDEKKASLGDEVTQNVKEAPGEVRRFGKKIMSKEAVVEAKRLEQESLKKFGKFLGVEVEFQEFEGADADANGYYLKAKNTVVLNSRKLSGLRHTTRIFLHEVTHPAQDADTNLTKDILNLIKEMRGEEQLNMLIKRTKDAYVSFYRKNNYDLGSLNVASEVAADYMMNIFESRAALDRIAGVKPSLVSKLLQRLGVIRRATGLDVSVTSHLDKLADRMIEAQQKAKEQKSTAQKDSAKVKAEGKKRYSFSGNKTGIAHDALVPYDVELRALIERGGNIIVDSYEVLEQVVNLAFDEPTRKGTAYFGTIPPEKLVEIKAKVHNLPSAPAESLFKPGMGYSIAVTLDSIRHLVDDKPGMTRADVLDYLDRMTDTIIDADAVSYSKYTDSRLQTNNGLRFEKRFPDGKLISFNIISNKKRSLNLQTLFMDSASYIKKKTADTPLMHKTSAHTPEARVSQSSKKTITDSSSGVKKQFSVDAQTDAAYMDAVNRGDLETAQKMVDEAAKAAGYTLEAYHGSNADFTVFDKDRQGKGIDQYGAGFYFASHEDISRGYGEKVYPTYLKLQKPIRIRRTKDGGDLFDVRVNKTQAYKILKQHPLMYDKESSPLGDFYEEYWEVGPKEWMIRDLAGQYDSIGLLDSDPMLFRNYPNELHAAVRDVMGYDGVVVYFDHDEFAPERNDYFYVAWFDNQMKSSEPVVRDDEGNVVPLSERFNETKNDIRYSVDSEGNQLSTEQQEFFKDSKVRDKEGKLQVVYHGTPSGGFTEFNLPEYFSVLNSAQGAGYYFTDKKNAQQYMKGVNGKYGSNRQLYKVYLNITNPLEIEQYSTGAITDDMFRAIAACGNYEWGKAHTDIEKILRNNKFDADRLAELVRLFRGEDILTAMREVTGHDGVRYTDKWGDIWVAWDKSQIKNVSNKAPTSNPDIRYSVDMTDLSEADQAEANAILGRLKNQARFAKYGTSAYGAYTAERMDREIRNSSSSTVMDYAKSYIAWVDPVDFIHATTTNEDGRAQLKKEAGTLDLEKLRNETQPIHLTVDFEDGRIVGHEGRHRMLALQDAGVDRVAVIIDAWNDDRHHTKPISIMNLRGQNFFNIGRGVGFYLHDMLPLSKRYAEVAKEYFAGETKRGVKFSVDAKTDADYMDAINRGDTETAQKMVDEVAQAAGYTVKGYHGSAYAGFTVAKAHLWFARDKEVANGYGDYYGHLDTKSGKAPHDAKGVYAMAYRLGKNLEVDAGGMDWGALPVSEDEYPGVYVDEETGDITTNAMAEWAFYNGYDSITFKDVDDGGYTTVDVIFNPNRDAKSADPVTYDDNGNVIPLSERFNEKNDDIRYSVGLSEPWVPDWVEDPTLLDADLSEMSVEQRDFFADSKARDKYGRLIPMYHGTNTPNFTVFDTSFSDDKRSLFFSSSPNVADTYTRQQDEGRDVDPYNLITEDSTAEQFNAAQEYVGGGLRVVKITEEWNAEMRQKVKEAEKRYFDGAMALAKHAQELAGDDEVLRNFFNYDVERIKSSIESDLSSRFSMIEGALDNIVNYADAISYQAERTLRSERIALRKIDDVRQMYRDSIMPEEELGKYLMTETNEMVEFRVEGKENYRFTHFIPGTEKEMVKRAIERSHWVAEHSLGNRYQVYLNLKNPLVVECGTDHSGRRDVNIYHDYHEADTYYVQMDTEDDSLSVTLSRMELIPFIIRTFDEENRMKVLNQLKADFQAYKDKWGDLDESLVDHNITLRDVEVTYVQPSYWNSISFMGRKTNTRTISAWAKDNGYDGVIFNNLKDTGGWAAADPGASTVMIAFYSNQVKATTNRKPTEDRDIRYSVNSIGEEMNDSDVLVDGMTVTEDGKRYSIKSMRHDIEEGKMFKDLVKHCAWTQEEVDDLQGKIEHLLDIMEPHRDILDLNETFGRDERKFSPYKENSDPLYKISLDFSTLCSKRLLTQYVIEKLQLQENRPMGAEEQMAIRDLLIEYGKQEKALQVACTMCYVEAARLKAPEQMNRWLADPEYFIRDYFGKKNKAYKAQVEAAQADFKESKGYDRNATKKQMSYADKEALNLIGPEMYANYKPSTREQQIIEKAKKLPASTYLTADNLARLSESEPEIYDAYVSCIRSATRSKALETAVPYYYGDSKRKVGKKGKTVSDKFIAAVNSENGMRFSSWSDWRVQHLLDFITAVIENSVRGAAMHGYTKYVDEVRVLGKTGMMFNMSGVPAGQTGLDENGNLLFSETDSVDIEAAKQARNEFPETGGIQCIGVSDDHIRKLLQSDFIDYVIPYHVSGMNADLRRMGGIHKWKDYTDVQHAKALSDDAGKEPTFSEFFVGYDTGVSGIEAMKASAERYKRLCKERGLTPKFNDFAGEENYWKLLVDRKMINQVTGQLIEQKPVKADFDFDLIEQIVQKYVDNFDNGLEAKALAYVKKNWDSIPSRIEELKKRDEAKSKGKGKKKKSTPVDRAAKVLANEALAAQPKQYSLNPNTGYEAGSIQDRVLTLLKSGSWEDAMTQLQDLADELGQKEPELTPDEKAFHDVLMGQKPVTAADKAKNRQKLDDLVKEFGAHQPGEKPARPIIIPKDVAEGRGVSKHVRTVMESEHTPDWFVAEIERLVAENAEGYTYDIATDRAAMRHVEDKKGRGFQRNLAEWEDTFNGERITKNDIALGEFLYTEAVKAGDVATATRLVAELSAAGTRAGQTVQAMSLLKKMTPSGQLYYLQKAVEKLNKDLEKQGKAPTVEIDADLAADLLDAETPEEMQAAMEALLQDIANKAPVTVMDKWNTWRYLAMLGNPKTHIRNLASNAVFSPAIFLKDLIGAVAQNVAGGKLSAEEHTKSLREISDSFLYGITGGKRVSNPYIAFADADFANMADVLRGGGKQNPADLIRDKRPIFKSKATQWINTAAKTNSQWMENEDGIFLKLHYVRALSQYLAAQNADIDSLMTTPEGRNQLLKAREWAVQEAQKATFRDASAFASALSRFEQSNKAAGVLVGGLLPFKKTPINILKRGIEYSPLGVIKMVTDGVKHRQSAAMFVDRLAATLTGTGIMALGLYLAAQGLLRGSGSDDDKEKQFEELQGAQNYSLQLSDGTSFTIDWMAPAALPLFVGCEVNKILNSEGKFTAADLADTMSLLAEPMFNLSMLDGLNNTLKSAGYSESPLTAVGTSILTGYVGQAVPTLLGQVTRTLDGTRRSTYIDKNKNTVDWLDRAAQYNMTKIPGASESLVPKLDAWGRTDDQSSFLLGALENFLSPGYINSKKTSPMENELLRLYKATGESSVLPKMASKYFTVNGERYDLSGEEWTSFQKLMGQSSYQLLTNLVNSKAFQKLSDAEKVEVIEDVYTFSRERAKTAVLKDYIPSTKWIRTAINRAENGYSVEDYILNRSR